jgi:predicted AAA+ superfamily ATPase
MFGEAGSAEDYISDAEQHNPWWSASALTAADFDGVTEYSPRSDFFALLDDFEDSATDSKANIHAIYGQTGIGKTTLIRQFIAGLIDETHFDWHPESRSQELVQSVSPRQILYIPLEESLYNLDSPEDAILALETVLDYFRSHIANPAEQRFVFLDDIGALRLDDSLESQFLEIFEPGSVVLVAGHTESQVDFGSSRPIESVDTSNKIFPMLTMKFIDTIKKGIYDEIDDVPLNIESGLSSRIRGYQTPKDTDTPPLIRRARRKLKAREMDGFLELLKQLYFEELTDSDRQTLHQAAEVYLRHGGILYRTDETIVRNELVKSRFLLYLYKELAHIERVQEPANLHRLSSIAATQAGEELQYTELAAQIGVDRRTIDSYLETLEAGKAVSEANEYSIRQHRRTRLYLRNPRHLVTLSQKQEHFGFETFGSPGQLNHEFQYKLAKSVIYDHARRLAWQMPRGPTEPGTVEYETTDSGVVDYILEGDGLVVPFALSYHPHTAEAEQAVLEFDPSNGNHSNEAGDTADLDYACPVRFVLTDSFPRELEDKGTFLSEAGREAVHYLPYWLFLLIS